MQSKVDTPEAITLWKTSGENLKEERNPEPCIVVGASNHSLCMSRQGRIYSWGYCGKGILGRPKEKTKTESSS